MLYEKSFATGAWLPVRRSGNRTGSARGKPSQEKRQRQAENRRKRQQEAAASKGKSKRKEKAKPARAPAPPSSGLVLKPYSAPRPPAEGSPDSECVVAEYRLKRKESRRTAW